MRQLELDFQLQKGPTGPSEAWAYRFSREALVEENGAQRVVYGLWETLFGCWVVNTKTGRSVEWVPTWRPLNENGVWRDQGQVRLADSLARPDQYSPRWRYQANAAFAGYFSGIPGRFRTVVAALAHHQWLGLDLIWQDPRFADFLDGEQFNDTEQYVYACFELANAAKLSRAQRRAFAATLLETKRTEVLSKLVGRPATKATLRALYKLGDKPLSGAVYRSVIGWMDQPEAAKAFGHVDRIELASIEALTILPKVFLTPNMIRMILLEPEGAEVEILINLTVGPGGTVLSSLADMFTKAPTNLQERARASLSRVVNFEQFLRWVGKWEDRLSESLKFPPVPIEPANQLVPLTSSAAMRAEGRTMGNCVGDLVSEVINDQRYFYHWDGPDPATVMIENQPGRGWIFADALGPDNEPLTPQTITYINDLFDTGPTNQTLVKLVTKPAPSDP